MKYKVNIIRIGYAVAEISIEANNKEEAKKKALQEAPNRNFSEHTSDYEVENIIQETNEQYHETYL